MDKVVIIDTNNFVWRANITFKPAKRAPAPPAIDGEGFVNPPAEEQKEEDYVIVYNFFRNLRVILEKFAPAKCFFALEGHPQFRYDLYPEYKANRLIKTGSQLESREKFNKGLPEILRLLKLLPMTLVRASNYEADDVVSTLIEDMKDEDITVISNDSDYIQLLQKGYSNLAIYNPFTKANMEAPEYHYIAWKSLAGDSSDNIQGLVGKDKAKTLVLNPEKMEEFLNKEENRANFNINRELIELRNIPLEELSLENGEANFDTLKEEFEKMKFATMLKEPYWTTFKDTFSCITL